LATVSERVFMDISNAEKNRAKTIPEWCKARRLSRSTYHKLKKLGRGPKELEAGGHRGTFDATQAETRMVGLFSLLPTVVDAVKLPVVAAGGIADGRGVAAALLLGASAVQVGTALLRCPEARVASAWADAIRPTAPEDTMISRVFSGRPARSIANAYARAATSPSAPPPAPYPVQRGLTQAMRDAAAKGPYKNF
jgi:nitronate monooxygenase